VHRLAEAVRSTSSLSSWGLMSLLLGSDMHQSVPSVLATKRALDIEAKTSLELFRRRIRGEDHTDTRHRQLKHHHGHHYHRHRHKEHRKHRQIQDGTQHGMMIDAGSQGTRIHVYEFEARVLSKKRDTEDAVAGKKISIPTTDTRWTDRLHPGLDAFAFIEDDQEMIEEVSKYLSPLIEFAERVLAEKKHHWNTYPIYLKATGGLRALPRPYRVRLITAVRTILENRIFNPFFFEQE
jgi:GDA1/CD39 (nucleoside phosphatase) family